MNAFKRLLKESMSMFFVALFFSKKQMANSSESSLLRNNVLNVGVKIIQAVEVQPAWKNNVLVELIQSGHSIVDIHLSNYSHLPQANISIQVTFDIFLLTRK